MKNSSLWTKTVALGMLMVAGVLGNASVSASSGNSIEATGATPAPIAAPYARSTAYGGLVAAASEVQAVEVADEAASSAESDGMQVVPAIYAWDPDVQFVFYRHVSKWM